MGTYRNANNLNGITALQSFNYYPKDNLKLYTTIAASQSSNPDIDIPFENQLGYSLSLNSEYKKEKYHLNTSIYNQSSDFYLAGSDYGFVSDRLGAKINTGYSNKDLNLNMGYNKFFSNLQKRYDAWLTDFDEVNLNLNKKLKNIATARINFNGRQGENNIGRNLSYYNDFNLSKTFKGGIRIETGRRENCYKTDYFSNLEQDSGFRSVFADIYAKLIVNLPKNKGMLQLEHSDIECKSSGFINNYKLASLEYTFPQLKRFLIPAGCGYRYNTYDSGLNYKARIGYRMKSGMIVSINYQYNINGGYILDNMYIPSNARHSINFTFNDTFAFAKNGIKPVGNVDDKGFLEVTTYLDKNKNGIYDKEDITVPNVPIKNNFSNKPIYTNNHGAISMLALEKGVYTFEVDKEKLNATLISKKGSKEKQMVLIEPKQHTKIAFALTSCVGNIYGNLKIIDDFDRKINIKEFIVVLHDENDNEVDYSTIDEKGNYYFSGVSPGNYTVMLDESFVEMNNLIKDENSTRKIEIPFIYKDFVDIKDVNLVYKTW